MRVLATRLVLLSLLSAVSSCGVVGFVPLAGIAIIGSDAFTDEGPRIITQGLPPAMFGAPYSLRLSAIGGSEPYTWSISEGSLPTGLSLAGPTGEISGAPDALGNFGLEIEVRDHEGRKDHRRMQLTVEQEVLVITTLYIPKAVIGVPYGFQVEATGGFLPYSWNLAGTPPGWLTLDSFSGEFAGMPSAEGTFSVQVRVQDGFFPPQNQIGVFSLSVKTVAILSPSLPPARVGMPYGNGMVARGGVLPYVWSLEGSPPSWLAIDSGTGALSGTPVAAGSLSVSVKVRDGSAPTPAADMETYTLDILPMEITTAALHHGTAGEAYSCALTRAGGFGPFTWNLTVSAPSWLSIHPVTGELTGTPPGAGTFSFPVEVRDSTVPTPNLASRSFSLEVKGVSILTEDLPYDVRNSTYNINLAATGGTPPYSWSLDSGALPEGLSLSTGGVIFGSPVASGFRLFTVKVRDAGLPPAEDLKALWIKISEPSSADLFDLGGNVDSPFVDIDGADAIHLVWVEDPTGNNEVYYARRSPGGSFSWPVNLSRNAGNSTAPRVRTGPGGVVHVVWHDDTGGNNDVLYRRFFGGRWSETWNVSNSSESSEAPDLAVNPSGNVAVLWQEYDSGAPAWRLWYALKFDVAWTPGERVFPGDGTSMEGASVDADRKGALHLAYRRAGAGDVLEYARFAAGSWSSSQVLYTPPGAGVLNPDLKIDAHDFPCVFLAFNGANPTGILRWRDGSGWHTSTPIPQNSGSIADPIRLAVTPRNRMACVHRLGTPNTGLWITSSSLGDHDSFMDLGAQFPNPVSPSVAGDSLEEIYVAAQGAGDLKLASLPGLLAFRHRIRQGLTDGVRGTAYTGTIEAMGGVGPYRFTQTTGGLPPGLILDGNSGVVSGTPPAEGAYVFAVRCSDNDGSASTRNRITEDRNVIVWIPPENAENSMAASENASIVARSAVDAHLVWDEDIGGSIRKIFYSHYNGTSWSSPVTISNTTGSSTRPSLALDSVGRLHLAWEEYSSGISKILYITHDGQSWSTPGCISHLAGNAAMPRIHMDASDRAHVVWHDDSSGNEEIHYTKRDPWWSIPINISNTPGRSRAPDVVVDARGHVYVLWEEEAGLNWEIFVSRFSQFWLVPKNLSSSAGGSRNPRAGIDSGGRVHAVWQDDTVGNLEIYHSRFDGLNWPHPQCLSYSAGPSSRPVVLMRGDAPFVFWCEDVSGTAQVFHTRFEGGHWRPPFNLSGSAGSCFSPAAAATGAGELFTAWSELQTAILNIRFTRN